MKRVEDLWSRLRADGLRRTPQREAIVEVLADAGAALPASVVFARARRRLPGLGERTLERTVALLTDAGALDAIPSAGGAIVYRLCGVAGHHHHLVCRACGAVAELSRCDIPEWVDPQAAARGFQVDGHDLTVHGLCSACRS